MQTVILLVGTPGVGKSWVAAQLRNKYNVLEHDNFKHGGYADAIVNAAKLGKKPVLANTPFGMSSIVAALTDAGITVVPVFIVEADNVVAQRYMQREGKPIPKGHVTRQRTYLERAKALGAFVGTSSEVLEYLQRS